MTLENVLQTRAEGKCELCGATDGLRVMQVGPGTEGTPETSVLVCGTCDAQIAGSSEVDINHWRCLNESMWSQEPAVQVTAWRMLTRLSGEDWARSLLDMLYLEDGVLAWAQDNGAEDGAVDAVVHKDCNGVVLAQGDTVTLIKDLNVKGAGFTAKRGTAVRGISLVDDNAAHIEGRVSGQRIVILTEFVKKTA
ncbi:MAG: protein PhnA [Parvibaculaceae bacterium]|jgi:protein PhnA|nr:PhnA domain-containing protein [Parvibaculaceae bacterium]